MHSSRQLHNVRASSQHHHKQQISRNTTQQRRQISIKSHTTQKKPLLATKKRSPSQRSFSSVSHTDNAITEHANDDIDSMVTRVKACYDVFRTKSPRMGLQMLGQTISVLPTRNKTLLSQQALLYGSLLASPVENTEQKNESPGYEPIHKNLTTTTTTATADDINLAMPHVPKPRVHSEIAQQLSQNPQNGVEIVETSGSLLDNPSFIPPTPSRTIPIIHDGLEWDEPNFIIKPFVNVIDLLHDTTALPWWGTLVAWAWILRTSISPLTYKQQASGVKFTLLQPDLMRINKDLRQLDKNSTPYKEKQAEIAALYKKHGVGPFTTIFWSMASIPFYICSFMAIRNMANSPYFAGEFATGGIAPFLNLSASAGWELATLNALVNLVMLHAAQPLPMHKMQKLQKVMFLMSHGIVACTIPLLSNINTASIFYFIANNSFSILFQKLFYSDIFRKIVKLPTKDEVLAVRDIVQTIAQDPNSQGTQVPTGANKNAFILGQDGKKKVGAPTDDDILSQARAMVQQQQDDRKQFALGGTDALEKTRLEREAAKKKELEEEKKRAEALNTKQQLEAMSRNAVPSGYTIHTVGDNTPKPLAAAKTVSRKGNKNWKKH